MFLFYAELSNFKDLETLDLKNNNLNGSLGGGGGRGKGMQAYQNYVNLLNYVLYNKISELYQFFVNINPNKQNVWPIFWNKKPNNVSLILNGLSLSFF